MAGGDTSLAFLEWSAEDTADPAARVTWARANPGLGIRIAPDYIERERAALGPDAFARERLSVGDWPAGDAGQWSTISSDAWGACAAEGLGL